MTNFYKDKQQIIDWLDLYEVKNYTLVPDEKYGFIVNVNGNVYLSDKKLLSIPVKFSEVVGSFSCYSNKLTSLEFSPQIIGDDFSCGYNKLASIEFSPQIIGDDFSCNNNKLTSLEFCPQAVGGSFYCHSNKLTSLEFFHQTVSGSFLCHGNTELKDIQKITDFKLIFLKHKEILINKFSDKLNNNLISDKNKKTAKIKI